MLKGDNRRFMRRLSLLWFQKQTLRSQKLNRKFFSAGLLYGWRREGAVRGFHEGSFYH